MKITIPVIRKNHVGTRYHYAPDVIFHDSRPNSYGGLVKEEAIHEFTVEAKTVFVYDFRAAGRIKAAGALVLAATVGYIVVPVVVAAAAIADTVIETAFAIKEIVTDNATYAGSLVRDLQDDTKAVIRAVVREVVR